MTCNNIETGSTRQGPRGEDKLGAGKEGKGKGKGGGDISPGGGTEIRKEGDKA
jgi:hypothetical protein